MVRLLSLALMAVVIAIGGTGSAFAKECKAEPVIAEGQPFISRSLGAYPSSLIAWRSAARERDGNDHQSWRKAEDRKVECLQVKLDDGKKRWVCTRSARPCAGGGPITGGQEENKYEFTRTLRRGDKGDDVEALQKLLDEAGYEVTVDGDFGRSTQEAVRAFQKANDLGSDGVAGPKTFEVLAGGQGITVSSNDDGGTTTVSGEKPTFTGPLQLGSRGSQVKALQELLKADGYDVSTDGVFGSTTMRAIRNFQRKKGLEVDGVAGTSTQEALGGVRI